MFQLLKPTFYTNYLAVTKIISNTFSEQPKNFINNNNNNDDDDEVAFNNRYVWRLTERWKEEHKDLIMMAKQAERSFNFQGFCCGPLMEEGQILPVQMFFHGDLVLVYVTYKFYPPRLDLRMHYDEFLNKFLLFSAHYQTHAYILSGFSKKSHAENLEIFSAIYSKLKQQSLLLPKHYGIIVVIEDSSLRLAYFLEYLKK